MKNTFGTSFAVTVFGESHGTAIGAIIDGITPGIEIDEDFMASQMDKRKGMNAISTARREADKVKILSGVFEGKSTGTAIALMIENADTKSKDYGPTKDLARPAHADYTAFCKYHGYQDYRGGGHFSGRITAPLVAAGSVAIKMLESKGIFIGTHMKKCAGVSDIEFDDYLADIKKLNESEMPMLSEECGKLAVEKIAQAKSNGDSVGGILQTAIVGMPSGVGEPWFDSLESLLSHAMFSIPAVKGIEFGAGFDFADMTGAQANDSFKMQDGKVVTTTNNNGGINGGISNAMPIIFSTAIKPTPSIYKEQDTVNFMKNEDAKLMIHGRHDPAIIHRARVVVDSMTAITLCDILAMRFGTDWFKG